MLDPDVEALVREAMRERGISLEQAVSKATRVGLSPASEGITGTPTSRMGFNPAIPWDKALRVAAEIEDEEVIRKLAAHKTSQPQRNAGQLDLSSIGWTRPK